MNLLATMDDVIKLLNSEEKFDLCLFDLSKAFLVVYHCVVCAKLEFLQLHPKVDAWTTCCLVSKSLRFKLSDEVTAPVGSG